MTAAKLYFVALCLAVALTTVRGQSCSDSGGTVASACADFTGDIQSNSGLSDNSSYRDAITSSGREISSDCCDAFSSFLGASCRCNSDTAPLISGAGYSDSQFQQVIYAAGIACEDQQGVTLKDPQYGETCNNGEVSGGK